ncbi:adhesion G-protein coupled receptor D2-like [Sinocyclocheilus rhinocerous]|uniref:adhesion G-protein coupled receptor D2-like n=1 Tax=Sinocyclocheilus rhinocerous TaxID=307959 RepID=UPI0007BADBCC|nr:PREDICTED: adhesion G-protein coupled receptor D2-like [Sinocyclocheilus rhinocerous]
MDARTRTAVDHHMASSRRQRYEYTYEKMSPVLFGVILANAMIKGMCEPTQSWSGRAERGLLDVPDSNLLIQNDAVYHLVNTSFSFEQAQRYCRGQSSALTTSGVKEDEEGARQLLSTSNLKGPVWFETNKKQSPTPHLPLPKQKTILRGLSFTSKDGYARVNASFPPLSAVSVCVRLQWDPRHENVSTVFSYAAPVFLNEFQLRGQIDKPKRNHDRKVRLALLIQEQHHPYKAELPVDEDWHHVCVTWRSSDGFWAIYVDGKKGDSGKGKARGDAKDIHGDGIFILGQDQDSFGGTLTEPFFGNLTDLNVWAEALEFQNVKELNTCSQLTNHRALFRWQDWNLAVHQSVQNVSATLNCPGSLKTTKTQEKECEVFNGWSDGQPQYSTAPCTHTLPFICRMSKEHYLKMKDLRESLAFNPSSFMQSLMHYGVTADDVLSDTVDGQSWASVSRLLNVSEQVVLKEQKQLEDRDMLSLMHVLSRAAHLPSTDNHSRRDAESLSQSFITIADSLISQDNASKWNSIKEVVKGPMAVIQTVDRMVSNLKSLLMDDTDSVQIHSNNIKLQVQQKLLSESSHVSAFCGLDAGNRDCISVPAENMKELQNNGFNEVTLLNTWYSSVNCLSEREENITLSPIVSDGSHRHLRTVLGSSVISSTVLADGQPISMAMNFRLQHRIQNSSQNLTPICSFWDFDLMPDRGGWSTKGCTFISSLNNSTSCSCNHTTNFALLLQISEVQRNEDETGLQIFSLIGSGVSLCGLIFTFILFVAVGVPKSDRTTVHKNLIVALVVAQLLLIFSDWASGNQEACWLVTVLLHLFFLSSFCWMLVEGLMLWSKVVSVNISEERRMKLYYVLGWGLPVVIVAVTLAATFDRYKAPQHCWLNLQSHVIWAFAGPVLFVLAVNGVVLFRVVMVTVASARRRAKMLTPSSDSKLHTLDLTWAATRPVLILLPVLGLTWLCGVLVHLSVVVAYVFITLNAFQGLYIFLVYAVYNSEVRNAIRRIQDKRKALSFTNCSQPISFLPSQKSPSASWVHSLPTHSSPESSKSSTPITTSTANSLVFKNERFKEDHIVSLPLKPANISQVVQLTASKPSGC